MIKIYTDGACSGNPGEAGIGVYFESMDITLSEYIGNATNNIAELTAILKALQISSLLSYKNLKIYTDSNYSIGILSKNWKAKANKELIKEIKDLMTKFSKVEFVKVKGHSGEQGNEIVDKLATSAIKHKISDLRSKGFPTTPLDELLEEQSWEEPKVIKESKPTQQALMRSINLKLKMNKLKQLKATKDPSLVLNKLNFTDPFMMEKVCEWFIFHHKHDFLKCIEYSFGEELEEVTDFKDEDYISDLLDDKIMNMINYDLDDILGRIDEDKVMKYLYDNYSEEDFISMVENHGFKVIKDE